MNIHRSFIQFLLLVSISKTRVDFVVSQRLGLGVYLTNLLILFVALNMYILELLLSTFGLYFLEIIGNILINFDVSAFKFY